MSGCAEQKKQVCIDDLYVSGTVAKNNDISDGPVYLCKVEFNNERVTAVEGNKVRVTFRYPNERIATNDLNYTRGFILTPGEPNSVVFVSENDGKAIKFTDEPVDMIVELVQDGAEKEEVLLRLKTALPNLEEMKTGDEWVLVFHPIF